MRSTQHGDEGRKNEDPDEARETPADEPSPLPVQDPPPEGQPEPPYVVASTADDIPCVANVRI